MKRALVFLLLGPFAGSIVTILMNFQIAPLTPVAVIAAVFFGFFAGLIPCAVLCAADWFLRSKSYRLLTVAITAFVAVVAMTFHFFIPALMLTAAALAAGWMAMCSWLSSEKPKESEENP